MTFQYKKDDISQKWEDSENPVGKALDEILEIVLITYNRKAELERTLNSLFSKDSPVAGIEITVLDNASTDGSSHLIDKFAKKHGNLAHIRHETNIGGNANICRAFERARKEYIWVLADDDYYDWTGWQDIRQAMNTLHDAIFTTAVNLRTHVGIGTILYESGFVPSCIYRSKWINSDVLQGMYFNIHTCLPHVTIAIAIMKANGRFFLCEKAIVNSKPKMEDFPSYSGFDYDKGIKEFYSPYQKNMFWEVGFLNLLGLFDGAEQEEILDDIYKTFISDEKIKGETYLRYILLNWKHRGCSMRNLFDIYWAMSEPLKKELIRLLFSELQINPLMKQPTLEEWNMLFSNEFSAYKYKFNVALKRQEWEWHPVKSRIKRFFVNLGASIFKRFSDFR